MIVDGFSKELQWASIHSQIEKSQEYLQSIGVPPVKGFSFSNGWKKYEELRIKNAKGQYLEIKRKTRSDQGSVRNCILKNDDLRSNILPEICYNYYSNATLEGGMGDDMQVSSARNAVDLLLYNVKLELEKGNDQRVELLVPSVRQATYRWFLKWIDNNGIKQVVLMANHYNAWRDKFEVRSKGAFTNDINFMDYWAIDDHKFHVSGGEQWDELLRNLQMEDLQMWSCIDMYTMKPLAYVFLTEAPTSEDIINLLIQAIQGYGLPKKAILFDNGRVVTASNVVKFVEDLKRHPDVYQHEVLTEAFEPCRAYSPTEKSNIELFHSILEREASPFIKNFTSGRRENGRHSTAKLSPEECENTIEELKQFYTNYFEGYFLDRPRDLERKGKFIQCSYNELFKNHSREYKFLRIDDSTIRSAYCQSKIITYNAQVKIKINRVEHVWVAQDYFSYIFDGKQFLAKYLSNNLRTLDLYALTRISGVDRYTGEEFYYEKGQLVVTLVNLGMMEKDERKALQVRLNKQKRKALKAVESSIVNAVVAKNPLIAGLEVNSNNELVNIRKKIQKQAKDIVEGKYNEAAKVIHIAAEDVITEAFNPNPMTDDEVLEVIQNAGTK